MKKEKLNFFKFTCIQSTEYQDINYFEYFSILLQEICISLDSTFLNDLLNFYQKTFLREDFNSPNYK